MFALFISLFLLLFTVPAFSSVEASWIDSFCEKSFLPPSSVRSQDEVYSAAMRALGRPNETPSDFFSNLVQPELALVPKEEFEELMKPLPSQAILLKHKKLIEAFDRYFLVRANFEKQVLAELGGFTLETLQSTVKEIALGLSLEIEKEKAHFSPEGLAYVQKSLKALGVLSLQSINENPTFQERVRADEIMDYACGVGLSYSQASVIREDYSAGLQNKILICPAFLVLAHQSRSWKTAAQFILAHEVSHLLDRRTDPALLGAQESLLSCYQEKYSDQFKSFGGFRNELEGKLKRTDLDPIDREIYSLMKRDTEERISDYFEVLGHEASAVESHAKELVADYWATRVTNSIYSRVDLESEMGVICTARSNAKEGILPDGDEGVHPSFDFRIENFLRFPATRSQLSRGLRKQVSGQWCDL